MCKPIVNLCIKSLLLLFLISQAAARISPAFSDLTPMKAHKEEIEVGKVEINENCSGVGEEECLMRRTLAAHIDYIYTQGNKHN